MNNKDSKNVNSLIETIGAILLLAIASITLVTIASFSAIKLYNYYEQKKTERAEQEQFYEQWSRPRHEAHVNSVSWDNKYLTKDAGSFYTNTCVYYLAEADTIADTKKSVFASSNQEQYIKQQLKQSMDGLVKAVVLQAFAEQFITYKSGDVMNNTQNIVDNASKRAEQILLDNNITDIKIMSVDFSVKLPDELRINEKKEMIKLFKTL